MIVSVVSPFTRNTGNTVSTLLLGLGFTELKRRVLLSHIKPQSPSIDGYLGLKSFDDKTSTPAQLVKLMREGAIQPEEIGDYCKLFEEYLHVFSNTHPNFLEDDMSTLLDFITESTMPYDYVVFDIDEGIEHPTSKKVISKSDIIILNLTGNLIDLDLFNQNKENLMRLFRGKKIILLCSKYNFRAIKTKQLLMHIGAKATLSVIRYNSWIGWGCNTGKLPTVFKQGKIKNPESVDIYKDACALASVVAKARIEVSKASKPIKGVF